MNRRQMQMIAFSYLAEKIAQGKEEAAMADESGIDMPECFRGWVLEYDDFRDWLNDQKYLLSFMKPNDSMQAIFYEMQYLIGLN